jgi:hypothetical protein
MMEEGDHTRWRRPTREGYGRIPEQDDIVVSWFRFERHFVKLFPSILGTEKMKFHQNPYEIGLVRESKEYRVVDSNDNSTQPPER